MSTYKFKTDPWKHQLDAFNFAIDKPACMLALSMGFGKSKIVVDLIANRDHRTVLIVCPKSVMQVWPKQFALHDPLGAARTVEVLRTGTCNARATRLRDLLALHRQQKRPLAVVVNYDAYWQSNLGAEILGTLWDCVVLDESHRIKSPGGRASWFAKKLKAKYRLCCTGTPMPQCPLDLYGQFRFLDPTIFGTNFTLFRARYAIMGGFENRQAVAFTRQEEMNARFYSIGFRAEADLGLPETTHIERTFDLCPEARRCYKELERELVAEVEAGVVSASNALTKLLRLQQITSGFVSVESYDDELRSTRSETPIDGGKASLLLDILEDLAHDEPIIVFCRFRRDLDSVRAVAENLSRTHGELSGRANDLSSWQAGQRTILAVQIQSGGLGVDFTRARYAIYYSLGFSLGEYEQSLARIHRPGQSRPCFYLHLIASGTVDEKVYEALRKKKDVVNYVLSDFSHKGGIHGRIGSGLVSGGSARGAEPDNGHEEAAKIHGAGTQAP